MASSNKPKSRNHGPDFFPEIDAPTADGAYDSPRATIGDDDDWQAASIQSAVTFAGDHRMRVDQMMV